MMKIVYRLSATHSRYRLSRRAASAWGRVLRRFPGKPVFSLVLQGSGLLSVSSLQGRGLISGRGLPLEQRRLFSPVYAPRLGHHQYNLVP